MNSIQSYLYKDITSISIDVTELCQLHCEYCFASKSHRFLSKHDLILILNQLKLINQDLEITLMGGEPTLYPFLNYMLEQLYNIKNVKSILLFTNGIRELNKFKLNSKVTVALSYHQSQNNKSFLLRNIEYLRNKNINYFINVMMVKDLDLSELTGKMIPLFVETKHGVHFINSNDELFNRKVINIDNKEYSLYEYSKLDDKYKNYQNFTCHVREYLINLDLFCQHYCLNEMIELSRFAEYVNSIKEIKCPFIKCKKAEKTCVDFFVEK